MSLFKTLLFKLMYWMDAHKAEYNAFKASYDTHVVDSSAHHTKYTDAEAVSAINTEDMYIKNSENDETTGLLTVKGIRRNHTQFEEDTYKGIYILAGGAAKEIHLGCNAISAYRWSSNVSGLVSWGHKARGTKASPSVPNNNDVIFGFGCRIWNGFVWKSVARLAGKVDGSVTSSSTPSRITIETCPSGSVSLVERLAVLNNGNIDIKNNKLTNPKNYNASALSGTKKLIEINIGGVPYYFEVYPTKA